MSSDKASLWTKPLAASQIAMIATSVIAIAAVAAAVFLYALPVQTEVLDAKAVLDARKAEFAAAQQQYTLDRVDQVKVEQLFGRIPQAMNDSLYLAQLTALAKEYKLLLTSFTAAGAAASGVRGSQETANAAPVAAGLEKVALSATLYGKLPDLQQYIAKLHTVDPFYAVTEWSIGQADSTIAARVAGIASAVADVSLDARVMSMNMTIETYLGSTYAELLKAE